MNKNITIAIDGPSGSGKSSTARSLSSKLSYIYIDTGAMYRAITLWWLNNGEIDESNLLEAMNSINIELKYSRNEQRTYLNGIDVTEDIRLPEVTSNVSYISSLEFVRKHLVGIQRELGKDGGIVMDGRDIGTHVFPNAELKIFLIADSKTRAERRLIELEAKGIETNLNDLINDLNERDKKDSERELNPLMKATDAIEIDTSKLSFDEQVNKIFSLAKSIIEK